MGRSLQIVVSVKFLLNHCWLHLIDDDCHAYDIKLIGVALIDDCHTCDIDEIDDIDYIDDWHACDIKLTRIVAQMTSNWRPSHKSSE